MATGLPDSTTIEIEFTDAVWTDVTSLVNVGAGAITRKVGRSTQLDTISAGSLSFTLDNPAGAFTPDNALSTYYPNVVEGKRVRWKVTEASITYTRFLGYITQWVPEIDGASASTVNVNATDALGHLSTRQVWSLPETEIRYDSPLVYYTLDHSSDLTTDPFYSAVGGPSLRYQKAPVDGTLNLNNGVGAPYDPYTCPTWTRGATSKTSPYLVASNVNANNLSTFTIEVVVNLVEQTAYPGDFYGILKLGEISIGYEDVGNGVYVYDGYNNGSTVLTSMSNIIDGQPHTIAVTSTSGGSVLYVDGVQVDTGVALTAIPKGSLLNVGRANTFG